MFDRHPEKSCLAAENFGFAIPMETTSEIYCAEKNFRIRKQNTPYGIYHTVETGEPIAWSGTDRKRLGRLLAAILNEYRSMEKCALHHILLLGLGNPQLSADALGPAVCRRLSAALFSVNDNSSAQLHVIAPGVPAQTGISTVSAARTMAMLCDADVMLVVDALSAQSQERLGKTIQLSNIEVAPASGTLHSAPDNYALSRQTMPCPVFTLGVPTVIRSSVLCGKEPCKDDMLVTTGDIDCIVEQFADVLAAAIVRFALHAE